MLRRTEHSDPSRLKATVVVLHYPDVEVGRSYTVELPIVVAVNVEVTHCWIA
jgi:hypothetical protein